MVNLLRQELELSALPPRKFTREDRFLVTNNVSYWLLGLSDIVSLEAQGNYLTLTDPAGHRLMIRKTLSAAAARLPAEEFFQTSREMIVNLAYVKEVGIEDKKRLFFQMTNGRKVILSRQGTKALRRNYSF